MNINYVNTITLINRIPNAFHAAPHKYRNKKITISILLQHDSVLIARAPLALARKKKMLTNVFVFCCSCIYIALTCSDQRPKNTTKHGNVTNSAVLVTFFDPFLSWRFDVKLRSYLHLQRGTTTSFFAEQKCCIIRIL